MRPGERVAVRPVIACGRCYPCSLGRGNACANISLVGIHRDGGLQERIVVPDAQVFPAGDLSPALAALVEPVSIAVRAVARGRVAPGERVVVLGAGPIGQAVALAATDRDAEVLLVDRLERRLQPGRASDWERVLDVKGTRIGGGATEHPDEATGRMWADIVPLRRMGELEELQGLELLLASPASSFLTGVAHVIDSGSMVKR